MHTKRFVLRPALFALISLLCMPADALSQTLKLATSFDLPGPAGMRFDYLTFDPDDHGQ